MGFDKHYSPTEEQFRYSNWQKDVSEVELHNALYGHEFTQEVNEMSDLSEDEYKQFYLRGLVMPDESVGSLWIPEAKEAIPSSVDWREKDMVTGVKNQGQCGSCYAFSATGALEGAWKKKTGQLISLSEQQIVDCSSGFGNNGCNGGTYQSAWGYIDYKGGIEKESDYAYTAVKGRCHFNKQLVVEKCKDFKNTAKGDEKALTQALAQVGPVSIAIDSSPSSFRRYKNGVHYSETCKPYSLNHAILAVGFGSEEGKDYFLVKNSWGTRWGLGGYIKMARNRNNNCGIASNPSFPIV